jgi:hypothetical protein
MTKFAGIRWGVVLRLYHAPGTQEFGVRVVQHVFRRGTVYWWRRWLLKKAGESELAPVGISLRTRDLSKARTIAAPRIALRSTSGRRRLPAKEPVDRF